MQSGFQLVLHSVQFNRSVVSNSVQPHGLQHTRLPCPSPTPGAYSNLCPLSQWCHPTISSSVIPFSSCLQSLPASILPMNIQDWFPLALTGLIFAVQGTLKCLLQHHSVKVLILWCSAFFMVQLSHAYMTTGKNIALTIQTFVGKAMSLLFNTLFCKVYFCK